MPENDASQKKSKRRIELVNIGRLSGRDWSGARLHWKDEKREMEVKALLEKHPELQSDFFELIEQYEGEPGVENDDDFDFAANDEEAETDEDTPFS